MDKTLAAHAEFSIMSMPFGLLPAENIESSQSLWFDGSYPDLSRFKHLVHLRLNNCDFPIVYSPLEWLHIMGQKLTRIPPSIGALTQLLYLNLNYTGIQALPAEIGLLENLIELHLSFTRIHRLPREFFNLKLVQLFLDGTAISDLCNVNPIRLRSLGIEYTKIQVFSMPLCLDDLYTSQAISANYFKQDQCGDLWYTHPLPIELINTNVRCHQLRAIRASQFSTLK